MIMMARLRKTTVHLSGYKPGETALLTTCKMIAQWSMSGVNTQRRFRGTPLSWHYIDEDRNRILELEKVISRLARDEDDHYVNVQDEKGRTALYHLLKADNMMNLSTSIHVLLRQGADPNLADHDGETPLCLAVSNPAPVGTAIWPLFDSGANSDLVCPAHRQRVLETALDGCMGPNEDVIKLASKLNSSKAGPGPPLPI